MYDPEEHGSDSDVERNFEPYQFEPLAQSSDENDGEESNDTSDSDAEIEESLSIQSHKVTTRFCFCCFW